MEIGILKWYFRNWSKIELKNPCQCPSLNNSNHCTVCREVVQTELSVRWDSVLVLRVRFS